MVTPQELAGSNALPVAGHRSASGTYSELFIALVILWNVGEIKVQIIHRTAKVTFRSKIEEFAEANSL